MLPQIPTISHCKIPGCMPAATHKCLLQMSRHDNGRCVSARPSLMVGQGPGFNRNRSKTSLQFLIPFGYGSRVERFEQLWFPFLKVPVGKALSVLGLCCF